MLLNFLRDRLTLIAQPIVLWGTSSFTTQLARNAPDFWSWKGHFFSFTVPQPMSNLIQKTESEATHPHDHLPPIRRYLRRVLEDPDYAIWKDLYLPLKASRTIDISPFSPRHTLTYEELRQLAPLFPQTSSAETDHIIFKKGDIGDNSYIIVSGEVEVTVPDALGNDIIIARLSKGDFFGEISLLKRIPRTATVRTTKPSKFVVITPGSLGLDR